MSCSSRIGALLCFLLLLPPLFAQNSEQDPHAKIQRLIANTQFDEADQLIRSALLESPTDTRLLCLRGTVAILRKDLHQAEKIFRDALLAQPTEDLLKMNLAEILFQQKRYAEAASLYTQIPLGRPTYSLAQYKQVLCAIFSGDRTTALHLAQRAAPTPNDPAFYYIHAAIAFDQGDIAAGRYFSESARLLYRESGHIFRLPLIEAGWIEN